MTINLVNRLDVIAKDRATVKKIFNSGSPEEQMKKVRSLLNSSEQERYDAGMKVISSLHDIKMPKPTEFDLSAVVNIPRESLDPIEHWLEKQGNKALVYGSVVDYLYTKDKSNPPNDIDIAVKNSVKASKELANIISDTSGQKTRITKYKNIAGYTVEMQKNGGWVVIADLHPMSVYNKKMPYDWEIKEPVIIDGIRTEQLANQLYKRGVTVLNPGVGIEGRTMLGPIAAKQFGRQKDIAKMASISRILINEAQKQGKVNIADNSKRNLEVMTRQPVKHYPVIFPVSTVPKPRKRTIVARVNARKTKNRILSGMR